MTLSNVNPQQLYHFASQHQHQLRWLVIVVLSIYLIAFGAKLTWQIIPEPEQAKTATFKSGSQLNVTSVQRGGDIAQIQRLNLFGDAKAKPQKVAETVITEAPETRLNLTLTGVVASSNVSEGAAIIENRGKQATYGIGEKIEGTNATLDQVQNDRVIIKNAGRHETLMLDGLDYKKTSQANAQVTRKPVEPSTTTTRQLSDEALEATEQLRQKPGNFTDYISITPYSEEGQLVGYKVTAGKNPALFESAGLQAGDIIIQINGLDLTDRQQAMEAMGALRSAQSIELTVTRDGNYMTLYLDMPEPEQDDSQ